MFAGMTALHVSDDMRQQNGAAYLFFVARAFGSGFSACGSKPI
jgi:hypothetical protein